MSIKVENLTNRPVLLRLNSGRTLHLAPRTTSEEVMDVEVQNNAKAQKLEGRRVIALHQVEEKRSTGHPEKKETEPKKRKARA